MADAAQVKINNEKNPFKLHDLSSMIFANEDDNPKIVALNAEIADVYQQARKLFDQTHVWTVGKINKSAKILEQLVCLRSIFSSAEVPDVAQYFADKSRGVSLAELLQAKRVVNPFVLFAKSWVELQKNELLTDNDPCKPVIQKNELLTDNNPCKPVIARLRSA